MAQRVDDLRYELKVKNFFQNWRYISGFYYEIREFVNRQLAPEFSPFELFRVYEENLSNIIADLLNPHGKHGQGTSFLEKFLELFHIKDSWSSIEKLRVKREYVTNKGKIDIIILDDNKQFSIVIENKWTAQEQEKQIERYYEYAEENFGDFEIIYLTPTGVKPISAELTTEKLKLLSYREDIHKWLESCMETCKSSKVSFFIKDFDNFILESLKEG